MVEGRSVISKTAVQGRVAQKKPEGHVVIPYNLGPMSPNTCRLKDKEAERRYGAIHLPLVTGLEN